MNNAICIDLFFTAKARHNGINAQINIENILNVSKVTVEKKSSTIFGIIVQKARSKNIHITTIKI
ncbi:MAG: hypothetical protein KAQ90_04375, partial [Melioribacteraceae bacterium]|nr:hypothetical protein [Melioribacteraceae bacterium]